jgi:hypothetical protein
MESCSDEAHVSPTESPPDKDGSDEALVAISEDFEVFLLGPKEASEAQHDNPYVQELSDDSFLSILQSRRVKNAFENEHERGMFQLFLSRSLFESMLMWTNIELMKKGKPNITLEKLMAYIGLELAMSLVEMGSIKHYWSQSRFEGHHDFRETMPRNDFETIRAPISPQFNTAMDLAISGAKTKRARKDDVLTDPTKY